MPIHDHWILADAPDERGVSLPVATPQIRSILIRRGVVDDDGWRRFARASVDDLHEPAAISGMPEACERIERAIGDREAIAIYGDYDVDGITSIVLLRTVLTSLGASVEHVVPHRLIDGYGLKTEVLDRILAERDIRLVITVDCGISSVEPVERALERGIDVIITDHHLPPGVLPSAAAVLNPKQPGCSYPFKELAGVGVAFKLCCELLRRKGSALSIASLLKIAAIGTIADVAPLVGENRTIAALGLAGLAEVRNPGLRALLRHLRLAGRPLSSYDVGFRIGPRLNAAGRLASADTAIRLFSARSEEEAMPLVEELERLNRERQQIEARLIAEADQEIEALGETPLLFLVKEGWHRGVLGLCAGKIAQKHYRPTLVVTREGSECIGSGRSIPSINLHAHLERVADRFTHFGGHEFACGFSFPASALEDLRSALTREFETIDREAFRRSAQVDAVLPIGEIDRTVVEEHRLLEPFGQGHREPLFAARGVRVESRREFSPGCFSLRLRDGEGKAATAVLWPSRAALAATVDSGSALDVLYHLESDRWSPEGFRLVLQDADVSGNTRLRNESPAPPV